MAELVGADNLNITIITITIITIIIIIIFMIIITIIIQLEFTPLTELDYGTFLCWAENSIGR